MEVDPLMLGGLAAGLAGLGLFFWLSGGPKKPNLTGLKYVYFPVAARGDAAMLMLHMKGIPFEDKRIPPSEWMALKPTTPWGSIPYVELADGAILGQSYAILRLIGKSTGYYPTDPIKASRVDECLDGLNDVATKTNGTGQGLEIKEKVAKRSEACKAGGDIYVAHQRVEALYERVGASGPFLVGELTIADLQVFAQVGWATSGFFDGVNPAFLAAFPRIQAARRAVISIPEVAAYYEQEKAKPYMELKVGGHLAKECFATMLSSSRAAA